MAGLREFLEQKTGKYAAIAAVSVILVISAYVIYSTFGGSEASKAANERVYIDASTGKPFNHKLVIGETIPIKAPSGKQMGYPAELCFWTKDGKGKAEPTPVLLNQVVGKPGPTFCPDCGRLVVGYNPYPGPNKKPPP